VQGETVNGCCHKVDEKSADPHHAAVGPRSTEAAMNYASIAAEKWLQWNSLQILQVKDTFEKIHL
jgi:hypothetical protein